MVPFTVGRNARTRAVSTTFGGDRLEGLYASPEFAGQGVGAGLLDRLEGLMRDREFPSVHAEASSNARGFYLRRGYRATGIRTPEGAWPMAKELT